jgi:hypothetical protein
MVGAFFALDAEEHANANPGTMPALVSLLCVARYRHELEALRLDLRGDLRR